MLLKHAFTINSDCLYIAPLECAFGDLDDKGIIKDYWRKALNSAGIDFDIGNNNLYLIDTETNRIFYYGSKQIKYFLKIVLLKDSSNE